ncbi:TetR/AcrR family transcriptional regulator [uncultured Massilia sp.]|uniref:TetR/AcrR family transcriptional regulator n=1 Tax=uncultured Massilia sp. TaxID=169973 RepID=UPI0025E9F083|nr:TetR/AcrR family transcriptional regulator [uncultured Massilia sp.]
MKTSSPTSDAILAHARTLIASGGYNGFSYADIAEAVGIRKASIHHHFPAKADLVRTLVARYREDVEAGIAQLERGVPEPLAQLQAYVRYWETCLADGSMPYCVCAMLGSELPLLPPEVALEVRAHFRFLSAWLASVLERGVRQGTIRLAGPARVEAEAFMATVHGAMLSARAYGDPAMFGIILAPLLQRLPASR